MTLQDLNNLSNEERKTQLTKCCGSSAWVQKMAVAFPFSGKESLLKNADEIWNHLSEEDWREAFAHHPKIGDMASLKEKFANTAKWASTEQASVQQASQQTLEALAEGNKDYEKKFGYIFIVCATGKTADEMLALLQSRLLNASEDEIRIAAAEQAKITKLRLEKLLS